MIERHLRLLQRVQQIGMDLWSLAKEGIVLNPGGAFWLRARFRVPRGRKRIPMHALASMRDARPIDHQIMITIV